MAKRQREVEKREKAARKLEKKESRKRDRDKEACDSRPLDDGETRVLRIFRRFLMAPGQMLCLTAPDVASLMPALNSLMLSGFLMSEEFQGRYSLTQAGYHLMRNQT
jgi:hypothetical protein